MNGYDPDEDRLEPEVELSYSLRERDRLLDQARALAAQKSDTDRQIDRLNIRIKELKTELGVR